MPLASANARIQLNTATGSRIWNATAAVQDTLAGADVIVTIVHSVSGTGQPLVSDVVELSLRLDNTATIVRTFNLTPTTGTQQVTFSFTADGTSSGAARAGTVRMRLRVVKNTGLGTDQYDVTSDNGQFGSAANSYFSLSTGPTFNWGYLRGTTTGTTTLPGAGTLAYGDTLTATTVLGAAPYDGPAVTVTLTPLAGVNSATSSTNTFTTALGSVDNRFAAAASSLSTVTSFPNASLTSLPWTTATMTETTRTVDPRLTFTHLLQLNDNAYGTPPSSKNVASGQRLTSDLGFISARVTNANGTGVNGITWTMSLQDAGALVTALTTSTTSSTQGGQVGWSGSLLAWSNALPGGTWNKTCTITAPAGATGLGTATTTTYTLVAANPNLRLICGGGPALAIADTKHFVAGQDFLAGLVVFNTSTLVTVALDASPAPSAFLGRLNLATGQAEYLAADGITWTPATGGTVYAHLLTVSPTDANVYTLSFSAAQTATWGVADVFVVGKAYVGGVPVNDFSKEIVVSGINNHAGYVFDPLSVIGFGSR
jgi:hypothetical protein